MGCMRGRGNRTKQFESIDQTPQHRGGMVGAAAPSITPAGASPDQKSMASNQGPAAAAYNSSSCKDTTLPSATPSGSDHHAEAAAETAAGPTGPSVGGGGHPYGVRPWGNFLTDGGGQEVGCSPDGEAD